MSQEEKNIIPIDLPKGDFENFIGTDGKNKRIFFSGVYGIGKTYFLREFFKIHNGKYDVYHLFPVRYQISCNENIIELLKYDLLVELLKIYPDAFKDKKANGIKENFKLFAAFCKDRGLVNKLLKSALDSGEGLLSLSPDFLFQVLSKLGRPLNDILDLDKEFQEFKKAYLSGEKGIIDKFVSEVEAKKDLVATDYIGHLLRGKIKELKGDKLSVLILDDFDRVDPEHIFRILNVLSVHMDEDEENKFGFDHIIVVGDFKNIRSIFHNRYGENIDFQGYIDKFFTVSPFAFDNNKAIKERISQLIQQIQCEESLKKALGRSGIIGVFLMEIFSASFDVHKMNLRQLFKPVNNCFSELGKGGYTGNDPFVDYGNLLLNIAIKLYISICGSKEDAINILKIILKSKTKKIKESNWVYKESTSLMLRYLLKIKPNVNTTWLNKYQIQSFQNGSHSGRIDIYPVENIKPDKNYFYDTLIEYIEQEKYNMSREDYLYREDEDI
ncbi:MAG: hypothetical protein V1867_02550 [Candidatus Falkowbacteria bacterium]